MAAALAGTPRIRTREAAVVVDAGDERGDHRDPQRDRAEHVERLQVFPGPGSAPGSP